MNVTKFQLIDAFFHGNFIEINLTCGNRVSGVIMSIEREDGSGKKYNLKIRENGIVRTVFVRTID